MFVSLSQINARREIHFTWWFEMACLHYTRVVLVRRASRFHIFAHYPSKHTSVCLVLSAAYHHLIFGLQISLGPEQRLAQLRATIT